MGNNALRFDFVNICLDSQLRGHADLHQTLSGIIQDVCSPGLGFDSFGAMDKHSQQVD